MTDEDTSLDEFAPFCCQVARRAARGAMPRRRGGSARVITCACAAVALVALLAVALLASKVRVVFGRRAFRMLVCAPTRAACAGRAAMPGHHTATRLSVARSAAAREPTHGARGEQPLNLLTKGRQSLREYSKG